MSDPEASGQERSLYLGVDGGGSYVRAVIVDGVGRELGRGNAGTANLASVGLDVAVGNIRTAVELAAREAEAGLPVVAGRFGLAGVDRAAEKEMLLPRLADLAGEIHVTNDAELGLYALPNGCGICLVAGTGSIALGQDSTGRKARAGGWGHLVGDEGSGYDIGRRGLQAIMRAVDGRGPQTTLSDAIVRAWNLAAPDELIGRVYHERRVALLADVARLVFEQAEAGDRVARRIVNYAAKELALVILAAASKLSFDGDLPLAFNGGVLRGQPRLRAAVLRRVRRVRPAGPVVIVTDAALSAARSLATASSEFRVSSSE